MWPTLPKLAPAMPGDRQDVQVERLTSLGGEQRHRRQHGRVGAARALERVDMVEQDHAQLDAIGRSQTLGQVDRRGIRIDLAHALEHEHRQLDLVQHAGEQGRSRTHSALCPRVLTRFLGFRR
jgi:hypothetical protein